MLAAITDAHRPVPYQAKNPGFIAGVFGCRSVTILNHLNGLKAMNKFAGQFVATFGLRTKNETEVVLLGISLQLFKNLR